MCLARPPCCRHSWQKRHSATMWRCLWTPLSASCSATWDTCWENSSTAPRCGRQETVTVPPWHTHACGGVVANATAYKCHPPASTPSTYNCTVACTSGVLADNSSCHGRQERCSCVAIDGTLGHQRLVHPVRLAAVPCASGIAWRGLTVALAEVCCGVTCCVTAAA